ncbi:MAG: xanthine dehydrogenase family protein subunit M [Rhizobacter sp.]|nr:xanthine dehydrogenase family protein subunit M [Bacteriovorax sp.]
MSDFSFQRAKTPKEAVILLGLHKDNKVIGGGTNLLDMMKEGMTDSHEIIDINRMGLNKIIRNEDGGFLIGASVTNTDLAYHKEIEKHYPLLSKAILKGASPQIRNMATTAGNMLQRTRCYYFYDTATPCNKRNPGSGCPAKTGVNHIHAILGASESCIAVHPSDMCVALAALDAKVHIQGAKAEKIIPFVAFHKLPGNTPHLDNILAHDEIITGVELPANGFAKHHAYVKARERNSYAFALASAAVGYELNDNLLGDVRIALGGVAHKPWRNTEAEIFLKGKLPTKDNFRKAAEIILEGARGYGQNDFKIELAKRVVVRALEMAINNEVQL